MQKRISGRVRSITQAVRSVISCDWPIAGDFTDKVHFYECLTLSNYTTPLYFTRTRCCCSVLQYGAVYCIAWQCIAVCGSVMLYSCSVWQCVRVALLCVLLVTLHGQICPQLCQQQHANPLQCTTVLHSSNFVHLVCFCYSASQL